MLVRQLLYQLPKKDTDSSFLISQCNQFCVAVCLFSYYKVSIETIDMQVMDVLLHLRTSFIINDV